MKRVFILCIIAVTAFQSCKKDIVLNVNATLPYIKVTSVNSDTYHPGGAIALTWEGNNLPVGTIVTAELLEIDTDSGIAGILPQNDLHTYLTGATANDGQEVFYLPASSTGVYSHYGKNFEIILMLNPGIQNDPTWPAGLSISGYSNIITITP